MFDKQVDTKVHVASQSTILPNHLNTEKHRMIKNTNRAIARTEKAREKQVLSNTMDGIDSCLAEARATVRALEQQKKQFREETGYKKKSKRTTKAAQQLDALDGSSMSPALALAAGTRGSSTLSTTLADGQPAVYDTVPVHTYEAYADSGMGYSLCIRTVTASTYQILCRPYILADSW